jgi:hypothetical protein
VHKIKVRLSFKLEIYLEFLIRFQEISTIYITNSPKINLFSKIMVGVRSQSKLTTPSCQPVRYKNTVLNAFLDYSYRV